MVILVEAPPVFIKAIVHVDETLTKYNFNVDYFWSGFSYTLLYFVTLQVASSAILKWWCGKATFSFSLEKLEHVKLDKYVRVTHSYTYEAEKEAARKRMRVV